jgi:hypothetical protein
MTEEKKKIISVIEDFYVQGHVQYDPELYEQILHPDWKMYHQVNKTV